ncbi:DUF3363 domain-containing protein [Acetobacter syzygii]|uniref:DUF3363 domain-containing protein n=1 Tax=Acetobacter syzygii TaxID=146476 RepID=UPI0039E7DE3F
MALNASRDIPFNKLVLSQANVRRVKSGLSIEELARDIERRGLLQSLSVRPVLDGEGAETGTYEVPAGGRRFRALELLVKQKKLAKTAPVPCVVREAGSAILAEDDSLAENVQRLALHPLDQFRAFRDMLEKGMSEEEIAAAFFVTPAVVKQRLRLMTVSDKLLDVYEQDGMRLEQLMAFSISDDHTRQEQVWEIVAQSHNREGTAYAVIDGVDGRTHHVRFPDLDATGDGSMGSVVELRAFDDRKGQRRVALAVRSDLSIENQVTARGASWLDRQAVARDPVALGQVGFGAEVREAMERRAEQLIEQGLAERRAQGIVLARNLVGKLRDREVHEVGERLASETGRTFNQSASGEYVTGTYRQRMVLASGRYAMIDDGLQFQLVPWTPSLEKLQGRHVSGVARDDGGIDWSITRNLGL